MVSTLKKIRRMIVISRRDLRQRFRINKTVVKLLGYAFSVNPNSVDIITTTKCNSMCYDCSQNCRQAPAQESISLQQVDKFIEESIKLKKKWKKIVVSGGESILDANCLDILDKLRDYRDKENPKTKIVLLTNGRGEQVLNALKKVPKDIEIFSSNKTSSYIPQFISINAAPIDFPEYRNANFANGCRLMKQCGGALNRNGFYCCSTAGAIDRVMGFDLGLKTINASDQDFRKQANALCRYCGNFLYSGYKNERGFQTKSWKKALAKYKREKPRLKQY